MTPQPREGACIALRLETAARKAARDLLEAFTHLRRLVDHQDDECVFYRGDCQAHFTAGSEPGKCGTAEARAWLAEHDTNGGNRA
ncbi:MAG TPA: hypothetical protein VGG83_10575 [Trebonia sp.]